MTPWMWTVIGVLVIIILVIVVLQLIWNSPKTLRLA
jgi:hypothetical protein